MWSKLRPLSLIHVIITLFSFRMIELGLGIEEDGSPEEIVDDLPPLEGDETEASQMEEVD